MARYSRSTEIRKVAFYDITSLVDILEADWRSLFYLIPRRIEHIDKPAGSYALKYNGAQERELEKFAGTTNECARQLLEEWGSSGKNAERPTLDDLLRLLIKGGIFRAADELAVKLLKEDTPQRPSDGPAAPVDVGDVLKREIERGLEHVSYPNSELLNQIQSTTLDMNLDRHVQSKRHDVREFPDLLRDSMMDGPLPITSENQIERIGGDGDVPAASALMPNFSDLMRPDEQPPVAGPSRINTERSNSSEDKSDLSSSDSYRNESSSTSTSSSNQSEAPSILRTIKEEVEPTNIDEGLPNLPFFEKIRHDESSSNGLPMISALLQASSISVQLTDSAAQDYKRDSNELAHALANSNLVSDLMKFSIDTSAVINYSYTSLVLATANFDNQPFENGDIKIPNGRLLGQGGFGEVYLGLNLTPTTPVVAVKRLFPSNYKYREKFEREREILSKYSHQNIVKLLGYSDNSQLCLIYEYMPDGNLDSTLKSCRKGRNFPAARRLNFLLGIISAVDYLHGAQDPLIHRDVTPSNVLLHGETAKLGDFGLVKRVESTTATVLVGTGPYLSLEALRGTITTALDVYSFGVVMAEVVTAEDVVSEAVTKDGDLLERVSTQGFDFVTMVDRNVLPEEIDRWLEAGKYLLELSNKCLLDRAKRPSAKMLRIQIEEIHRKAHGKLNGCVGLPKC